MNRRALTALVLSSALLAPAALADGGLKLRWFRIPDTTAYSGTEHATWAQEYVVTISGPSTDTEEKDQVIGLRGISIQENSSDQACGIGFTPGYLYPSKVSQVTTSERTFDRCSADKKSAVLPDGSFITGLQVCTNGKKANESRVKGLRVWGARPDASAKLTHDTTPASFERANCTEWGKRVDCPAGEIATSVSVVAIESIQRIALRCAKLYELSKTPPPQVISVSNPTWEPPSGDHMAFTLTVEDTGQQNITYRGFDVAVVGAKKNCSVQAFGGATSVMLGVGEKKAQQVFLTCARQDIATSCAKNECTATIEWSLNVTQPKSTIHGSQAVTFPK